MLFGLGLLIGVLVIATARPSGGGGGGFSGNGIVEIWGTFPTEDVFQQISDVNQTLPEVQPKYVEKDPVTFEDELVRALAAGTGPDLVFVTDATLVSLQDVLLQTSYDIVPSRDFVGMFGDLSEVFADSGGSYAFPVMHDPLVVYYNKDILASSFVLKPAETWNDYFDHISEIARVSPLNEVERGGLALGTYDNVSHASDILSFIMLQGGVDIASRRFDDQQFRDEFVVAIEQQSFNTQNVPAEQALALYLSFADPSQKQYGWNSAQRLSRDAFLAGDLAYYIGYASEYSDFLEDNPNLNFGVTLLPQLTVDGAKMTYGRTHALGVSKLSSNPQAAFSVAYSLSQPVYAEPLSRAIGRVPAHRTALENIPDNTAEELFYKSAIVARSWPMPRKDIVDTAFRNMIRGLRSGSLDQFEALSQTAFQFKNAYPAPIDRG